ncbi:E3 ubiquitin-protein ligase RBBP6-like isoform X2 [Chironomus tepperi]|uniref:E3 ubiquitin-protein ligase RBBP6-like isoform X2 n=1 Tax=Chironomus tepperi TaxID=113505 RepID=UPI00391F7B83
MSVYYKFNSELNFSHVGFDGLHISVADLKKAILHQKRLGKSDFDLLISNAQTKEEYAEEDCLIPKNTSLIVARVPITSNQYKKWEQHAPNVVHNEQQNISSSASSVDLSKMNGSEEDKIQAMIAQSTLDYDPTKHFGKNSYQRVRGTQQSGEVPQHYRCHRCHKSGHWIKNCPLNPPMKEHHMKVRAENKKMTGIPRSLRENPPNMKEPDLPQIVEQKKEIPEDLLCSICKNIFKDAVMIPCCGSSFCDECIRTSLLESDDNECPECSEKGTSPGSLIPNRFLRNAVAAFQSDMNSLSSRDKQQESSKQQEEIVNTNEIVEEKREEPSRIVEHTEAKEVVIDNNLKTDNLDQISDNEEEEDDDDDNITVTVPSASQQSGSEFRELIVFPLQRQDSSQEVQEPILDNREKSKSSQYSDNSGYSGYYQGSGNNNSYEGQQKNMGNSYQENIDKNYQPIPVNTQNQYHQHGYNQHQNMHMPQHRPQFPQQGQYHQSGPPHQPYYGHNHHHHQQNMRPMRYEHRDFHGMNKHHNLPPMHAPMNDHYGMRYQPPSTNLANMVTQNIQQRFGTGIIEDPLEAFNKIMREKEMRKDRFKRSRSPLRQYSPDMRQKSPIRRRKRTRSFSSGSSKSYSRSRSRSFERHYPKENIHGRGDHRDIRRKHYSTERKKSETRSSRTHRNKTPNENANAKKSNYENPPSSHEHRSERSKPLPEPIVSESTNTNDGEPPPPGEEISMNTASNAENQQVQKSDEKEKDRDKEEKNQTSPEKEKGSADESKHSKKSRERKKHKKESRKKKKRDRKEKKSSSSKSNTPELEDRSLIKRSVSNEQIVEKPLESEAEKDNLSESMTEHENDANFDSKFDDYLVEPELSKWERDDSTHIEKNHEHQKNSTNNNEISIGNSEVTSEIIKRAENAIFAKAVNAIRPQEVNKTSSKNDNSPLPSLIKKVDTDKRYESVQVTVPTDNSGNRSIEIKSEDSNATNKNKSDAPKPASIKDRLGKKIDVRSRSREDKRQSQPKSQSDYDKKNVRRPYQLNSCISSISKYSDRRTEKKPSTRRSRSIENRSTSRKYDRSRSRSSNRNDHKRQKLIDDKRLHHRSVDEKYENKNVRDKRSKSRERDREREREKDRERELRERDRTRDINRSRHRTRSPKPSSSSKIIEKARSSSTESKKHKKKKKKEKKAKKKSRG